MDGESHYANFGCFNIDTQVVEFTQDLPDKDGGRISQIEAVDGKIYLRTSLENLYVYQHDRIN